MLKYFIDKIKIDCLLASVIFTFFNCEPTITEIIQVNEYTINIKWTVAGQHQMNLTRYIISYTTNNWESSHEWPGFEKENKNQNYLNFYFLSTNGIV